MIDICLVFNMLWTRKWLLYTIQHLSLYFLAISCIQQGNQIFRVSDSHQRLEIWDSIGLDSTGFNLFGLNPAVDLTHNFRVLRDLTWLRLDLLKSSQIQLSPDKSSWVQLSPIKSGQVLLSRISKETWALIIESSQVWLKIRLDSTVENHYSECTHVRGRPVEACGLLDPNWFSSDFRGSSGPAEITRRKKCQGC